MQTESSGFTQDNAKALGEFSELRQFPGAPREFWPRFLAASARLISADTMVLILGQPGKTPRWAKLGEWTASPAPSRMRSTFYTSLEAVAERTLRESSMFLEQDKATGTFVIAVRLSLSKPDEEVILAGLGIDFTEAAARDALVRLGLAADTPALYQAGQTARQSASDVEKFAAVLDLLVPVNDADRFLSAALAFCNGIATRFGCDRASLGWLEGGSIHLKAISRTEQFDRRMAAAQALESVMEECLDQDEEILWPPPEQSATVARVHEKFASEQKSGLICSLPIRQDGKAVAVLTCERSQNAFKETELQQLRLACDQVSRRLSDLKRREGWLWARWKRALHERAAEWFGPEHAWSKLTAAGTALVLLALFIVRVNYRVEGTFILRSDEASYLTAPFDGYIDEVLVRGGDAVKKGGTLLSLNRNELLLDQSAALADLARYQREAEKARAAKNLAEMRIDEALAQQAQARLDLVRFRLENAVIKSPFDGLVVEGDLRERIASPVKQGDALYKVARIDSLYAEAEVSEKDVKEILGRSKGEIAFVSQPKNKYPVTVEVLQPAAVTKKDGNVFLVRLKPANSPEAWWRPGMTGLCKLEVEKRTLFWILTHRTVDFLRMKLWF
jgi:multidrug resistance efflux pump